MFEHSAIRARQVFWTLIKRAKTIFHVSLIKMQRMYFFNRLKKRHLRRARKRVLNEPITILCPIHTFFIADLFQNSLKKINIESRIITSEPGFYGTGLYIVICPLAFRNLPARYFAFQLEQSVSSRWLTEEYFSQLSSAQFVFDYSLVNIDYFRKKEKYFHYLPIDYLPEVKRDGSNYEYDVLFYGDTNSPRRQLFLKQLEEHFSVKIVYKIYGDALYELLVKAKVVVNIHFYENALLETTRLYEVLSMGRSIIVSERSTDKIEDQRLENIIDFVEMDDSAAMIQRVAYWLQHDKERVEKIEENNKKLSEKISSFDYYFYKYLLSDLGNY